MPDFNGSRADYPNSREHDFESWCAGAAPASAVIHIIPLSDMDYRIDESTFVARIGRRLSDGRDL